MILNIKWFKCKNKLAFSLVMYATFVLTMKQM